MSWFSEIWNRMKKGSTAEIVVPAKNFKNYSSGNGLKLDGQYSIIGNIINGAENGELINVDKEMAEYIILTQGWTVKPLGADKSKIIAADKTLITKQGVPTEELHKWIVDNYEPNGTLKTKI